MWDWKNFMLGYFVLVGVFIVALALKSIVLGIIVSVGISEAILMGISEDDRRTGVITGMIGFGFGVIVAGLVQYSLNLRSIALFIVFTGLLSLPLYYFLRWWWTEMDKRISVN